MDYDPAGKPKAPPAAVISASNYATTLPPDIDIPVLIDCVPLLCKYCKGVYAGALQTRAPIGLNFVGMLINDIG